MLQSLFPSVTDASDLENFFHSISQNEERKKILTNSYLTLTHNQSLNLGMRIIFFPYCENVSTSIEKQLSINKKKFILYRKTGIKFFRTN